MFILKIEKKQFYIEKRLI